MQFKNVVIQSLAAIEAPVRVTSAELGERLRPTMERLGIRTDLIDEISGISARRFWENGTQPSDAATMAAKKAIEELNEKEMEGKILVVKEAEPPAKKFRIRM